jgi:hypothetical protein
MKRVLLSIGFIASLGAAVWVVQFVQNWTVHARTSRLNEDTENLFVALQKFKEHVGCYPNGSNAEIAKSLKGQNPKNVIILVGRKNETNDKGEIIDPWGTPLRIYFSGESILVRSAGQNKRFDDSTVEECDDFIRSN